MQGSEAGAEQAADVRILRLGYGIRRPGRSRG